MNDLKINISRSFTRKVNLGNYESVDFFSSRSMELPADTSMEEQQEVSEELFALAMTDVMKAKQDYDELRESFGNGVDAKKFRELQDCFGRGKPALLEDWEACTIEQQKLLNEFKKFYKRSDGYKETLKPRNEK